MKNCTLDYFENLHKGLGLGFNAFGLLFAGFWAQGLGQGGEGGGLFAVQILNPTSANPRPSYRLPSLGPVLADSILASTTVGVTRCRSPAYSYIGDLSIRLHHFESYYLILYWTITH